MVDMKMALESMKKQPYFLKVVHGLSYVALAASIAVSLGYFYSKDVERYEKLFSLQDKQYYSLLSIIDSKNNQLSSLEEIAEKQNSLLDLQDAASAQKDETILALNQSLLDVRKTFSLKNELVDMQREIITQQDKIIAQKDIDFHNSFPEFLPLNISSLSLENMEVLRSSLREDSPAPTHSSCYVQKMYLTEDPSNMILASGNCVFISPDLVLSNYHVLGKRELSYVDENAKVIHTFIRTDDGFQSFVSHPVALSPLYDLALVQLEEKNPNFQGLGISQALEEKYMKYSYSYTHPVDPEKRLGSLSVTSGNLDYLSSTQNYGYTQEGSHSYPSFYVTPALERGYSGSPVFQNGKLIGLVASVSFENGHTIITPHVKNFLEDILEEKEE